MVIQEIKATRFRWLGHLLRTDELHPCRKLTYTNPDDARKVGRPPVRRVNSVEEDLKRNGVNNCKPRQRTEWTGEASLERSRLESGCSPNMMMMMIQLQFTYHVTNCLSF